MPSPSAWAKLVARVSAILRRCRGRPQPESEEPIDVGGFHIDLQTRIVSIQGKDIHLTPTEFDLMVYMARHPDQVLTHATVLNAVWEKQMSIRWSIFGSSSTSYDKGHSAKARDVT